MTWQRGRWLIVANFPNCSIPTYQTVLQNIYLPCFLEWIGHDKHIIKPSYDSRSLESKGLCMVTKRVVPSWVTWANIQSQYQAQQFHQEDKTSQATFLATSAWLISA